MGKAKGKELLSCKCFGNRFQKCLSPWLFLLLLLLRWMLDLCLQAERPLTQYTNDGVASVFHAAMARNLHPCGENHHTQEEVKC
eukprot:4173517-Amphidinium_carterae.1